MITQLATAKEGNNSKTSKSSSDNFQRQVVDDLSTLATQTGFYTAVIETYEKYRLFHSWESFREVCLKNGITFRRDICSCRELAEEERFSRKK